MSRTSYTVRSSLIVPEISYRLEADGLHWQAGSKTGDIAYADIGKLQLLSYAGAGGLHRRCIVQPNKGKAQKFDSHHYLSLGNFENRLAGYTPFVRELCRRIAAANPQAQFQQGSTGLWLAWLFVGLLMAAVLLLVILAMFEASAHTWRLVYGLLGLVAFIPLIKRMLGSNKVRNFDPTDPPSDLIGG